MSPTNDRADKPCVALIGYRGSGKSVVGHELARLLGGDLKDTDEGVVDRAGRSIAEIFEAEGEAGFRRREAEAIAQVVKAKPMVISVGGGAVLDEGNVARLKAVARIVWLTAPPEVLWARIDTDHTTAASRPSLTGLGGLEEVQRVLAERRARYRQAADLAIDTNGKTPDQVAREIAEVLNLTR